MTNILTDNFISLSVFHRIVLISNIYHRSDHNKPKSHRRFSVEKLIASLKLHCNVIKQMYVMTR